MEQLAEALDYLNIFLFVAITAVAAWRWRTRPSAAVAWFTLTFLSLAIVTVAGQLLPENPSTSLERWMQKADIVVLLLFPYLLLRFVGAFRRLPRLLEGVAAGLTIAIILATLAVPELPGPGEVRPEWFGPYLILLLVQWATCLLSVAVLLWRAGGEQPSVARRRMRLLSLAATCMTIALFMAGSAPADGEVSGVALAGSLFAAISALAFFVGFAPPRMLRIVWRTPEQEATREAIVKLLAVASVDDLSQTLLPALTGVVGGRGSAMFDRHGNPLGVDRSTAHDLADATARIAKLSTSDHDEHLGVHSLFLRLPFGWMVIWTTPYTPFFGAEEIELLRSMGVIADLALDRVNLLEREKETAQRLRELNDLKNEFVAMVAHDLRSPMTVISGFADTIITRWEDLPDPDKLEYLGMISRNTRTLAQLVEDVLQVARIESGEFKYEVAAFDLRETIRRTVDELATTNEQRLFNLQLPEALPPALGDEERNWQILTNLISNALKFSPPDKPIDVEVIQHGQQLQVKVRDHGIGIRPEDADRIFDKFSRIDPVDATKRVKGTGLGLYICKSMIEAQGGTIQVDSRLEKGSTFTYTLPIAQGQVLR